MKILIKENGLNDALYKIEDCLVSALNNCNNDITNEFICKAYGAVAAINLMIITENKEVKISDNDTD